MKKVMAAAVLAAGVVMLLPAAAFAAGPTNTFIHGFVGMFGSSDNVADAAIHVTCNGHEMTTATDGAGSYRVLFPYADCPAGSFANVVATKGDLSGRNVEGSGMINNVGGAGDANVFVTLHPATDVVGNVVTANGGIAIGALVQATCDSHAMTTTTDANGHYHLAFPAIDCQIGGPWVQVVASKDGMSGMGSGPVLDFGNGSATIATIHLNVATVPEMGMATAAGAAAASGVTLALVRRRRSQTAVTKLR